MRNKRGSCVGKIAPQAKDAQGLPLVRLEKGGHCKTVSVAILVAEAFVPKTHPTDNVVRHLDGNPANCRADNLVWETAPDNMDGVVLPKE